MTNPLAAITQPASPRMDYPTRFKTVQLMEKYGRGFCQKLALAWYAADDRNKQRIEHEFADYMAEYALWGEDADTEWSSDTTEAIAEAIRVERPDLFTYRTWS